MSVTAAMLLAAYRELNSRRMFWITLLLSLLAVSVLMLLGISADQRLKVAWWTTPIPMPPGIDLELLLKGAFVSFGISFWLTWAATILALISTASIIPDFVSSGAIDLAVSKPVGRLRLFLLKYFSALLFVALQVTVFSLTSFVIIGWRTGAWEPGLLLAVPLVVVFFSYLYCICALTGLMTRSTIASLLTTLLFWLMLFCVNFTDEFLMMPRTMNELYVEKLRAREESLRVEAPPDDERLAALQRQLAQAEQTLASWRQWHGLVVAVKTAVPKTAETIKLLERALISVADLPQTPNDELDRSMPFMTPQFRAAGVRMNEVVERMERAHRERTVAWVLGTSLAFEAVVLAIAGAIFVRRDF